MKKNLDRSDSNSLKDLSTTQSMGNVAVTPHQRLYTAVSGGRPDRVPTLPKIWLDLAATLTGRSFEAVLQSPSLAMETVIEAALAVKADGVRMVDFPPRPHLKTVCDELHRYAPRAKLYCHICGNTLPILNEILAAGIDCIGPLDPLGGFTCTQARMAVGPGTALMGGMNTLAFAEASPEMIREQAHECIRQAGQEGAFVLGSGCALPRSSKRENLLALHAAAIEYGAYEGPVHVWGES